jgi:hypothetical protein
MSMPSQMMRKWAVLDMDRGFIGPDAGGLPSRAWPILIR